MAIKLFENISSVQNVPAATSDTPRDRYKPVSLYLVGAGTGEWKVTVSYSPINSSVYKKLGPVFTLSVSNANPFQLFSWDYDCDSFVAWVSEIKGNATATLWMTQGNARNLDYLLMTEPTARLKADPTDIPNCSLEYTPDGWVGNMGVFSTYGALLANPTNALVPGKVWAIVASASSFAKYNYMSAGWVLESSVGATGASNLPGSPFAPFATVEERTAWATANLASLRSGVTTVWGPGAVEYVWNGPLATDWVICRSGESFVLGTLVQILQLTPDANTVGIVSDVAGCVLQYNGAKWVGFIGILTAQQSEAINALGALGVVESGKINAVASIDPSWSNWSSVVYNYGFDRNVDRTWHHFTGPIETDSMISVLGGKGRWYEAFEDGGHLFEGWNSGNTERLTIIIGKVLHTASIFVFNPGTMGFGTVQIGSDDVDKGVLFTPNNMVLKGNVVIRTTGDTHVALNSQTGKGWELCGGSTGGGGVRNGPGIRAFGLLTDNLTAPGKLELFIGALTGTLSKDAYGLYVKSQTNNISADVFSIDGNGVARFLTANPVISNPTTPSSAASPGEKGEIAWDTSYIYVCIATNTWKRCAIATW